ncbi:MAG: helix-turn-helix transcriptional regulator [Clostridiales Family XIII bacterium]|nr:helix-turn-helix transcriptional regulator [Clostridiales Family XIII bacterium]
MKPMLLGIAKGIAAQFGERCEVAVHNLSRGPSSTIEIIENGHVSGRQIGDGASEIVLEALKDRDIKDRHNYITHSKDGKMMKSSTINVRGESGDVVAVISINYDIGDLLLTQKVIGELIETDEKPPADTDTITNNVSDLLEKLIEESRMEIGKPVSAMTKEDKARAVRFLEKKGALLIKKSSERISEYYGISKYTLYNYLGGDE